MQLIEDLKAEKELRAAEVRRCEKYARHIEILEDHIEKVFRSCLYYMRLYLVIVNPTICT